MDIKYIDRDPPMKRAERGVTRSMKETVIIGIKTIVIILNVQVIEISCQSGKRVSGDYKVGVEAGKGYLDKLHGSLTH